MEPIKQAPQYPQQMVRFGQTPNLPQGYENDLGASAYKKKFESKMQANSKTWRLIVCVGLVIVIMTVMSWVLGIVGIVKASDVVGEDID